MQSTTRITQLRISLHLAGWLGLMAVPFLLFDSPAAELFSSSAYACFVAANVVLCYVHSMWLLPKFYRRRRVWPYAGQLVLLLALVLWVAPFSRLKDHHKQQTGQKTWTKPEADVSAFKTVTGRSTINPKVDVVTLFIFVVIVITGIALETNRELHLTVRRALQAERDRTEAELSFLKARVNPHFLYNTLNSIYTLAFTGDPKTADTVMKLASIMRYFTDEGNEKTTRLEDELQFLSKYTELQSMRLSEKTVVNFRTEGHTAGRKIAPLLFMPLIENVFRFGASTHETSSIDIEIVAHPDHIRLQTRNRIFSNRKPSEGAGTGIINTRKRLQRLYPDTHFLNITTDDGYFTVDLTIQV